MDDDMTLTWMVWAMICMLQGPLKKAVAKALRQCLAGQGEQGQDRDDRADSDDDDGGGGGMAKRESSVNG